MNSPVTSKIQGFFVSDFELYKLSTLLGESWLEEDVFNALLEFSYFYKAYDGLLHSQTLPSGTIHLPTSFLTDALVAYEAHTPAYTAEILALRGRLSSTDVHLVSMSLIQDNHITAFLYRIGSATIEHGDSMHNPPSSRILSVIQWVFKDLVQPAIKDIKPGVIARQGVGNGQGSCGIAARNFIDLAAQTHKGLRPWIGFESQAFRDAALEDLLRMHHFASQSGDTFFDWTVRVSDETSTSGNMIATGYNDFNMYSPLVCSFKLECICLANTKPYLLRLTTRYLNSIRLMLPHIFPNRFCTSKMRRSHMCPI